MAETGEKGSRGPTPMDRYTAMLFLSALAIALAWGILGLKLWRISNDNANAGVAAGSPAGVATLPLGAVRVGSQPGSDDFRFVAVNA